MVWGQGKGLCACIQALQLAPAVCSFALSSDHSQLEEGWMGELGGGTKFVVEYTCIVYTSVTSNVVRAWAALWPVYQPHSL